MQSPFQLLFLAFFLIPLSSNTQKSLSTEIIWDTWGVPHIYAQNEDELFFAQGWVQMHQHGNLILELYGKSRGKGSEYWGKKHLRTDVLIHTFGFPELAQKWWEIQDIKQKQRFSSFVRGMNAYAEANPGTIEEKNKVVLPIKETDVNQHYLYVVYTSFVGGNEFGRVSQWEDKGSNTYAIAPSRSASGNAMLVQNPHLPWFGEYLFHEYQAVAPGINTYGVTLVGFPGFGIAFNENLGWSHTDNTIDNADTYELILKDGGYVLDGEVKEFKKRQKNIKVKGENGLVEQSIDILESLHGPVVKIGKQKALAIRVPGLDQPNPSNQWWKMATSKNFEEFESSLKMAQIPFWNVMYADQVGNIFYLFNGHVPQRSRGDWSYWNRIVPGDNQQDIWTKIHPYQDLPKVKNPEQGWLQNANDPPWTSTFPRKLNPKDFPPYMAPQRMSFRPQRSARMLMEDESISFDELVKYKLSTRMELADRLLDDLFKAIDEHGGELSKKAKAILEQWDKEANVDSKGALLFYNWARKIRPYSSSTYAKKWSLENARTTPDGLADPAKAVSKLEEAAKEIMAVYGKLDVPWGDVYRIKYNGIELPGNGATGMVGVFRVAWPGNRDKEKMYIGGGDSWVAVIEFGKKVKAKVLLSYGNATQANSPHNGDQLQLFSKKEMRDAWFYREDLDGNIKRIEVLENGKFSAKK